MREVWIWIPPSAFVRIVEKGAKEWQIYCQRNVWVPGIRGASQRGYPRGYRAAGYLVSGDLLGDGCSLLPGRQERYVECAWWEIWNLP